MSPNCLLIRHQIHISIYLVKNAQISFCAGSLQPAAQLGSRLSNSLSLFLHLSTLNDFTYFVYLARKFSLFDFTPGWSQAKMMCWTSCVTITYITIYSRGIDLYRTFFQWTGPFRGSFKTFKPLSHVFSNFYYSVFLYDD